MATCIMKPRKGVLCAGALAFVVVMLLCAAGCFLQEQKIRRLEEQVGYMKEECVPLRFEITENRNSRIAVTVALYDCENGNEIGSRQVELSGNELNVDFQVVQLEQRSFLFFPVGLYTNAMAPADSAKLYDLYDDGGFPAIYRGLLDVDGGQGKTLAARVRQSLREELSENFVNVRADKPADVRKQYGMAVHDMQSVRSFKKGFVYKALCHPHTGGIEIVKE